MNKHTPGPWRSGKWGASIISSTPVQGGINGSDAVESYGGHLIAESISECNMALIIAAPDLLAALKLTRENLRACQATIHLCGGFDPAYVRDAQAAMKVADAAIAKATA